MLHAHIKKVSTFGKRLLKMLTKLMLNSEELAQLNYERYYYPCPIVQKGLNAVYIKASTNFTNEKVSLLARVHYNSVGQWIAIYKENGFDGLCKITHHCNQSLLKKQAVSINKLFAKQPTGQRAITTLLKIIQAQPFIKPPALFYYCHR